MALALAGGSAAFAQTTPPTPRPHVDDPGKLPEPPASVPDLAYDSRILSSAASAEQFQGALDGGWTLAGKKGALYAFELTDQRGAIEGAWRDLRVAGEPNASGVLDLVQRAPPGLIIRFAPTGQAPVSVRLRPDLKGVLEQGGKRVKVSLRRAPTIAAERSTP